METKDVKVRYRSEDGELSEVMVAMDFPETMAEAYTELNQTERLRAINLYIRHRKSNEARQKLGVGNLWMASRRGTMAHERVARTQSAGYRYLAGEVVMNAEEIPEEQVETPNVFTVERVYNGFKVMFACGEEFVFKTWKEVTDAGTLYWSDPQKAVKKYRQMLTR